MALRVIRGKDSILELGDPDALTEPIGITIQGQATSVSLTNETETGVEKTLDQDVSFGWVDTPTWNISISYLQLYDDGTATVGEALAEWLFTHAGAVVPFSFTPVASVSAEVWTGTCTIVSGGFSVAQGETSAQEITLPVSGQPTINGVAYGSSAAAV